jgi:hypothetical protein
MSKGDDHKFTFDISGDLLLFKQETEKVIKQNYPPQAKYSQFNAGIRFKKTNLKMRKNKKRKLVMVAQ